jgi:hypothetical protein
MTDAMSTVLRKTESILKQKTVERHRNVSNIVKKNDDSQEGKVELVVQTGRNVDIVQPNATAKNVKSASLLLQFDYTVESDHANEDHVSEQVLQEHKIPETVAISPKSTRNGT